MVWSMVLEKKTFQIGNFKRQAPVLKTKWNKPLAI